MRLSPTLDVEHHHVRFLGNLVLNLWDCGGQDAFYESYFERDRETIFRSVELLIYVFDIESEDPEKDFDHFSGVLEAIEENSPDARIFVLVHKMDLVHESERAMIFEDRRRIIEAHSRGLSLECFATSIWDETLYKAWSEVRRKLGETTFLHVFREREEGLRLQRQGTPILTPPPPPFPPPTHP